MVTMHYHGDGNLDISHECCMKKDLCAMTNYQTSSLLLSQARPTMMNRLTSSMVYVARR